MTEEGTDRRGLSVSLQRYVDAQISGVHNHIERQFTVQQQQVVDGLATMLARIDGFYATRDQIMASLRDNLAERERVQALRAEVNQVRIADLDRHVTQIFAEKDRATEMATDERERAALALRVTLERAINEADAHLREHVELQVEQIGVALAAAELLERERVDLLASRISDLDAQIDRRIASVHDKIEAAMLAAREAVNKSEAAAADKFLSHNGLIEQMRQQAVKSEQTLAKVTGDLLPRETFETWTQGQGEWRTSVETRLAAGSGVDQGARQAAADRHVTSNLSAQWLGAFVAVIAVLVTIAIATHGFH